MKNVLRVVREFLGVTIVLAAIAMISFPQSTSAQEEPTVFSACRVPEVGAIYLIKIDGAPNECLSDTHVEFSWNEAGTGGETGPAGADGVSCWDLNGDGVQDLPDEDTNSDGEVNVEDCRGPQGETGVAGTTSHAGLTDLGDLNDDHPQYLLAGVRNAENGFAVTGRFETGTIPASGEGTRLMWYPGKAAFRAGGAIGGEWDDGNIGDYSTAIGYSTGATAHSMLALGRFNVLAGTAGSWVDTDPIIAVGNGTGDGSRSNALTLLKNGDLSVSGEVSGTSVTGQNTLCIASDCRSAWPVGGASDHGALTGRTDDDHPQYLLAGVRNAEDGFAVTGTYLTGAIPASGSGTRLMWYPGKAAFRAGTVSGDTWDDANIGYTSVAMGYRTEASGRSSVAMGYLAEATGGYSTAMGSETLASGEHSTAMGTHTVAQAYASLSIGRFNVNDGFPDRWAAGDFLFTAGNGSLVGRNNALALRKNGNLYIGGTLTQNSDARLKTDVNGLGSVLPKLERIRGVSYRFIDEQTNPAGVHLGLLAQEVQAEFPELVSDDGNGHLSVAYGNFTAVLLEAVKELHRENEELKARIGDLEAARLQSEAPIRGNER